MDTWHILRPFGICYGHLVYFFRFGKLYQEKSGNPDSLAARTQAPLQRYAQFGSVVFLVSHVEQNSSTSFQLSGIILNKSRKMIQDGAKTCVTVITRRNKTCVCLFHTLVILYRKYF
jgi:hypothetical protein